MMDQETKNFFTMIVEVMEQMQIAQNEYAERHPDDLLVVDKIDRASEVLQALKSNVKAIKIRQ